MTFQLISSVLVALTVVMYASCHEESHHHDPRMMMSRSHLDERHHIEQQVGDFVDMSQMTGDELRFHYFKMHDSDSNDKLDGCEIVRSLLHWHVEECKTMGPEHSHFGTTKIFGNEELAMMIDPILFTDDRNFDGFIDFPEFVAAQKSRGF
ncbi:hypothetical protein NPIL_512681 [Nephila pilipes]|uniref:Uncharacterized protein n=1 Tax=Nephila pilipes TaxID=299642 RepID=A0A8X6QJL3_NEPPI|nr:hypothetical protein NPIL_512681 [Nephila pilipes]